jgi:hypothetical protein
LLKGQWYNTGMQKKYATGAIILIVLLGAFFGMRKAGVIFFNPPPTLILQVPFSPQAPTDKWDRNEDCEETSITMANAFLSGNTQNELPASEAQKAIDNLKIWENANLGYNIDTGSAATTRMAEGAFAMKVKQIKDFTEQDLKQALAGNHPILLPIDARLLNNPRYRNSGPQYHMIVIRGYKGEKFVVNDPGTNSGNGNEYTFETLKNAAADWNQAEQKMDNTAKIALVMSK